MYGYDRMRWQLKADTKIINGGDEFNNSNYYDAIVLNGGFYTSPFDWNTKCKSVDVIKRAYPYVETDKNNNDIIGGNFHMKIFGNNSKVIINGKTYVGNNIVVDGDTVIVDGIKQDDIEEKQIVVQVLCNVDKIESNESIYIKGSVKGNVNAGTSVSCDDIQGNVRAGTSVNCNDIYGDAHAVTSINCDVIQGDVRARRIIRQKWDWRL